MHQQRQHVCLLLLLSHLSCQAVYAIEVALRASLTERRLVARDVQLSASRQLLVQHFHLAVVSDIALDVVQEALGSECIHRQIVHSHLAILHATTIVALVFVFHLLLVSHGQLVILLDVLVATLTHLLLRESWLLAEALVYLCFQNAELILLCFLLHAQTAIALSTLVQARPEVRILSDNL